MEPKGLEILKVSWSEREREREREREGNVKKQPQKINEKREQRVSGN